MYYSPTMSTHNFHNKCPLVRIRGTNDSINGFNDPIKHLHNKTYAFTHWRSCLFYTFLVWKLKNVRGFSTFNFVCIQTVCTTVQWLYYLCRALSVPIVMSVPQKSLSMDPTIPAICRWAYLFFWSAVILPSERSSSRSEAHSCLNRSAPVSEPSPPITTKFEIPNSIRFFAAFFRPSRSLKISEFQLKQNM